MRENYTLIFSIILCRLSPKHLHLRLAILLLPSKKNLLRVVILNDMYNLNLEQEYFFAMMNSFQTFFYGPYLDDLLLLKNAHWCHMIT